MKIKKSFFFVMFLLGIFSLVTISSYSSSVQLSQLGVSKGGNVDTTCDDSSDFIVQIQPFGCTPMVVRSDLLEEREVPVFCQLGVTKINPLVNINAIDSVSISGKLSSEVAGVAFYPAKAAIDSETKLDSSLLENIGYVIIRLKKQSNASAMPEFVSGNLTATLKYSVDEALGFGDGVYHIPEIEDEDWESNKHLYQFWGNRGYLKVEDINSDEVTLSVYNTDDDRKISSVTLKKGETSNTIKIPGVGCGAGIKLKVDDLENPTTRAQLLINNEVIEVGEGEKFLENKCILKDIKKIGLVQQVNIRCEEDEEVSNIELITSPKIKMNISGEEREFGVGDYLYQNGSMEVYLAYIGTKGDKDKIEDSFVYLISMDSKDKSLSEEDISSFNFVVGDLIEANANQDGPVIESMLNKIAGASNRLSRLVVYGQSLSRLNYNNKKSTKIFGSDVAILGYAGVVDEIIKGDIQEEYEKAKESYESLFDTYNEVGCSTPPAETYGEQALFKQIELASVSNQGRLALELCGQFKSYYPDSKLTVSRFCDNLFRLSSKYSNENYVKVNNKIVTISLENIYEPSVAEYKVDITIWDKDKKATSYPLSKGRIFYFSRSNFVQLISADNGYAKVKVGSDNSNLMDIIRKEFGSDIITFKKDEVKKIGDYSFSVKDIHLDKIAKVSLTSNINSGQTKTEFGFKVGIEQRMIKLSPDELKDKIEELDKLISPLQNISVILGTTVKGLKTACLTAGALFVTSNFIAGLGNEGTARQYVMRGEDSWTERCTEKVNSGDYSSLNACFNDNAEKINSDVGNLTKLITKQNDEIKVIQNKYLTKGDFFNSDIVDTDKFMGDYIEKVKDKINKNSGLNPGVKSNLSNALSYDGWKNNDFSMEDLKNIELYSDTISFDTASTELKMTANKEFLSESSDIISSYENSKEIRDIVNKLNIKSSDVISVPVSSEQLIKLYYTGLTNSDLGKKKINEVDDNTPIQIVETNPNRKKYIVVLESPNGEDYNIKRNEKYYQIYDYNTKEIPQGVTFDNKYYFVKHDASDYDNDYKNPELRYYETEPYKGLPAIVPFDTKGGWYVAMKQNLPTAGNIRTYDASGEVNSFYLCNVMENGLEEFYSKGYGGDECILINRGTGQPYSQIQGLDEKTAERYVECAKEAISQARELYPAQGKIKISTNCGSFTMNIGEPALNIPEFQCQDFASPEDCMLLFNLCDPVICPSSRCDFGGAYPVSDVTQSGIIGSLLLCLPNFQEGIMIPICLTGVKNGLDALLSVLGSYKSCLQESLDTGKMVGICDEMNSIYLCEFLWEQALPLSNLVVPKIVESMFGQNVRGGGEYLSVQSSIENAENSASYFSNYYGLNAKEAFTTRAKEVIQSEVCSVFISGVAPDLGDFVDTLTEPNSPVQYLGNFEENVLTTATTPSISQYKIFYQIYAGQNEGAYYQVYLTKNEEGSYYQDSSSSIIVASGYINVGGSVSETPDITAVSGYDKLCISVNGKEECGFKSITTNALIDYATESYVASQANTTGITTSNECISGTVSLVNILNLNFQEGVESTLNPAIYQQGIVRVCSTSSPGKTTDVNYDNTDARWVDVGYCDDEEMRCWIDKESVKEVINAINLEESTFESLSERAGDVLEDAGVSTSDRDFESGLEQIKNERVINSKINLINSLLRNVVWNYQKAYLLLLKGDTYLDQIKSLRSEENSDKKEESTSPFDNEESSSVPKDNSFILGNASLSLGKTLDSVPFIMDVLKLSLGDTSQFNDAGQVFDFINKSNDFFRTTGDLIDGDIVFLVKGCAFNEITSIGIVNKTKEGVKIITSNGGIVKVIDPIGKVFNVSDGEYIYRAYRYKNVDKDGRNVWNFNSAISKIKDLGGGKYSLSSPRKKIIDEFFVDGLLTSSQCEQIVPFGAFVNDKLGATLSNIKDFLISNRT